MPGSRGGGGGGVWTSLKNRKNIRFLCNTGPDPLKNHKNIGFLCNTGPDPLKNHKATKPAFNGGPVSARQRNAILMEFRCQADDGSFIAVFISSVLPSTKKKLSFGPPLTKLSGSAHAINL